MALGYIFYCVDIDDAENCQLVTQSSRALDNTCTTQNKKTLGEYRCGTGQKPSKC